MARLAFDSWLRATRDISRVHVSVSKNKPVFEIKSLDALVAMKEMLEPQFFTGIMEEFLQTQILSPGGALYDLYHVSNPSDFTPQEMPWEEELLDMGEEDDADAPHDPYADLEDVMQQEQSRYAPGDLDDDLRRNLDFTKEADGYQNEAAVTGIDVRKRRPRKSSLPMFGALWSVLQKHRVWTSGTAVIGGIGPINELMSMRLEPYMPVQGGGYSSSPYHSLFMAVEYGTGVAENVGGSQWIKRSGSTKEADGSWWLGSDAGRGIHFKGQRGIHFLDDARTRQPLPIYLKRLETALPGLVFGKLRARRK